MGCVVLIPMIGTKVGDPIETNAAGKVFSKGRDAQKPLRCVLAVTRSCRVANSGFSGSEASKQTLGMLKDAVSWQVW